MQAAVLARPAWFAQGLRWIASGFLAWARLLERRASVRDVPARQPWISSEVRRAEERMANLRLWSSIDAAVRHLPFPGEERARW